jgi:NAD-dependent SIR2 family protein deacetylase
LGYFGAKFYCYGVVRPPPEKAVGGTLSFARVAERFARIFAGSAKRRFDMDRVLRTLEVCTVFIAIGTSGLVEPAASFVSQTKARTFYVGPEEPLNLAFFDETLTGKAEELLPTLFDVGVG